MAPASSSGREEYSTDWAQPTHSATVVKTWLLLSVHDAQAQTSSTPRALIFPIPPRRHRPRSPKAHRYVIPVHRGSLALRLRATRGAWVAGRHRSRGQDRCFAASAAGMRLWSAVASIFAGGCSALRPCGGGSCAQRRLGCRSACAKAVRVVGGRDYNEGRRWIIGRRRIGVSGWCGGVNDGCDETHWSGRGRCGGLHETRVLMKRRTNNRKGRE